MEVRRVTESHFSGCTLALHLHATNRCHNEIHRADAVVEGREVGVACEFKTCHESPTLQACLQVTPMAPSLEAQSFALSAQRAFVGAMYTASGFSEQ